MATSHENRIVFQKNTIINDSVWGPIELSPTSWKIINTPEFQRLRFIKQLGGCYFVYPGACHNRFEHSIGTAHLARTLGLELQKNQPELNITKEDVLCLEVAGLCHDLGHGAFSHLFDLQFIKKARPGHEWEHEDASLKMVDRIFKNANLEDLIEDKTFIKELIKKPDGDYQGRPKEKHFLYEVVANDLNKIDVDKWDYFSRDCHMLGLHHNFQCERSIKIARVVEHDGERHISFPKSEYLNIFDMFSTRYTLHRQAYQHSVNRAVQTMISDAFLKADRYLTFPPNPPKEKGGKTLSESIDDMEAYIWVTDDVFHRIRTLDPEDSEDIKQAKTILDRILGRDFYKLIGEKKVLFKAENQKNNNNLLEKLKQWMESELKEKLDPAQKEMFEIQDLKFNYGNKDRNPMDKVYFYHWTKGPLAVNKREISLMMPSAFEQVYLQLFWKGSRHEHSNVKNEIRNKFEHLKEYKENDEVLIELIDTR